MVASSNNNKVRVVRPGAPTLFDRSVSSNPFDNSFRPSVPTSLSTDHIEVNEQRLSEEIDSTNLVPGDVIEIPSNGCLMSCDAVLVAGTDWRRARRHLGGWGFRGRHNLKLVMKTQWDCL